MTTSTTVRTAAIFFAAALSTAFLALSPLLTQGTPAPFEPLANTPSPWLVNRVSALAAGKFLIADRELSDPNFAQTVVLLIEYSEQGALGVIVNRPTDVKLSRVWPDKDDLEARDDALYEGGPVARQRLLILVRDETEPEMAQQVFADVSVSSNPEWLESLLGSNIPESQLRVYSGNAGWAPGQLDQEVARGGWLIYPADAASIFSSAPYEVWGNFYRRSTARVAALTFATASYRRLPAPAIPKWGWG